MRQRDERPAPVRHCECRLLQRRLPRTRRARPDRGSESGARRHEGGCVVSRSTFPPAAQSTIRTRLAKPAHAVPFADFDAIFAAAHPRGRRVLRRAPAGPRRRRRRLVQRQAFAGMIWSKQFFYYDVPRVAEGRSDADRAAGPARARPQPRLGASQQRRHHLDAGQVGVPVVRRVGPRVPHAFRSR